jgi:hypothetical protein
MLYTFDPKMGVLTFKGKIITGFADGTFFTVERTEDTFTETTGADGETTRVKSNNRSGRAKITLKQSSSSNDHLSVCAALDEGANAGVGEFQYKDVLGTTLVFAAQAYVKKPANVESAKTATDREWNLFLVDVKMFVGGNVPVV